MFVFVGNASNDVLYTQCMHGQDSVLIYNINIIMRNGSLCDFSHLTRLV